MSIHVYENNYIVNALDFVRRHGDRIFVKSDGARTSFKYTATVYGVSNKFSSKSDPTRNALKVDQETPHKAVDVILRDYVKIIKQKFDINSNLQNDDFILNALDSVCANGDFMLIIANELIEPLPYSVLIGGCKHRFEVINLNGDILNEVVTEALATYKQVIE